MYDMTEAKWLLATAGMDPRKADRKVATVQLLEAIAALNGTGGLRLLMIEDETTAEPALQAKGPGPGSRVVVDDTVWVEYSPPDNGVLLRGAGAVVVVPLVFDSETKSWLGAEPDGFREPSGGAVRMPRSAAAVVVDAIIRRLKAAANTPAPQRGGNG